MNHHPSRPRVRSIVVAGVTGALVAAVAGTAPIASGAPLDDPRGALLGSFAEQTRTDRPAAPAPSDSAAGKPPSTESRVGALAPSQSRSLTSTAADCASLGVLVTQTLDHSHVSWEAGSGAATFTVKRQRPGGAVTTIASNLAPDRTSVEDTTHNPMGFAAYTVDAVVNGTTLSCRSPEDGGFWSMSTPDGTGFPDIFFAGDSAVYEQDTYNPAFPSYTAAASRPAFSPTGRLVAAIEDVGGVPSLTVRTASTGSLQWSVASPAGSVLDEPAFSPDGQRIVVESLALPELTTSKGLFTVAVNATSHSLALVPGSAGLATPDWVDTPAALASSTIVAADVAPGGGLVLVSAATGARTPVAGTAGALDPMGRTDGSIVFTTYSDTEATLNVRSAGGTLKRIQTWADSTARWPVTDPETGNILIYLAEPDATDPTQTVWSVSSVDPDTGLTDVTGIGTDRAGDGLGFHGFDLRTYFSSGTSDFGGSANGDILARSSTGVLYAYPLSAATDRFFDSRRQIGTGWNTMKQFIAAGDLNSDRRADILSVDSYGKLWLYPGRGGFLVGARSLLGSGGWSSYAILSTGDFDGDTRADLIARDSSGNLWLYPGNGAGRLLPRKQIGSGWNVMSAIIGTGDWNYDGRTDLIARDRNTGYLYLYPGKGNGQFAARKLLGKGWNARNGFAAPEIWGGVNALFARTTTGVLLDYDSVGDGSMNGNSVYQAGTGWGPYTITG